MGERGPIPKRSDQRVRRNQEEGPIDKITAIGAVSVPDLDLEALTPLPVHPLCQSLYDSLKESAQSRYYEPSDWQTARLAMLTLNQQLNREKGVSAVMLATIVQILSSLMVTEGDRRRLRLEIERNTDAPDATVTQISDAYRERLGLPPAAQA